MCHPTLSTAATPRLSCLSTIAVNGPLAVKGFLSTSKINLISISSTMAEETAQLEAGVRAKPYTRRRARRDVNHNFQPQRSHLNRSSGFSLEAVLPQRGHFIVHICVKGPSGVTLKIWNVDSTVASSNRHLIGIHRDAIRFPCISGSTTLMEKLAQQNQSVEGSRVLRRMQKQRHDIR